MSPQDAVRALQASELDGDDLIDFLMDDLHYHRPDLISHLDFLLWCLDNPDALENMRMYCMFALSKIDGVDPHDAKERLLPLYLRFLGDPNPFVQEDAVDGIGRWGYLDPATCIEGLTSLLRNPHNWVNVLWKAFWLRRRLLRSAE